MNHFSELNDVSEVGREKAADYTPQIISEGVIEMILTYISL